MKFTPYPFQQTAIDHIADFFANAKREDRRGYSAPTGCGKSVIELALRERFDDLWIVTPRDEIIAGMMEKLGDPDGDPVANRICTPVKLRNMLLRGDLEPPGKLVFDEGHHHSAETWQQLTLLTGYAPSIALTATFYRGSPRSTRELLEFWGDPVPIITYEEACREGYIRNPSFSVLPLVDDDIVEVQGGEFSVTSIESATVDRLGDLAEHCRQWYDGQWDRPTIFSLPSSSACVRLQQELLKRGMPCATVSAATPKNERATIFQAAAAGVMALLHINIVTEGVDLPLRRLVDVAPTLSPVKWVQQLGRITRPNKEALPPEYVCTNRNLMRHAYALEGAVPVSAIADGEKKFPPTQRAHSRVLGLEAIGRFKPTTAKLLSGVNVYIYSLSVPVNGIVFEYCCLVHPARDPLWACKVNTIENGVRKWGSWKACEAPNDVRGFSSVPPREVTEKQAAWWRRSAASFGLDPNQEVTKKSFQALPVLADLGARL